MSKDSILLGIIGLLLGIIITGLAAGYAVNNEHQGMMRMMGMHTGVEQPSTISHGGMSMAEMSQQLKDKTGDEFDKAFIEMMISHHQGAIEMAKLIPERAKHPELKTLGQAIISAQTQEITDMQQWQKDWGYSTNEMMHGGR